MLCHIIILIRVISTVVYDPDMRSTAVEDPEGGMLGMLGACWGNLLSFPWFYTMFLYFCPKIKPRIRHRSTDRFHILYYVFLYPFCVLDIIVLAMSFLFRVTSEINRFMFYCTLVTEIFI